MFEKLIHLIDKWNQMVDTDDQVQFIYGAHYDISIGYHQYFLQNATTKVVKFGTCKIQSLYDLVKDMYITRFADPAIEPERFSKPLYGTKWINPKHHFDECKKEYDRNQSDRLFETIKDTAAEISTAVKFLNDAIRIMNIDQDIGK